jgi:hypothetical protein
MVYPMTLPTIKLGVPARKLPEKLPAAKHDSMHMMEGLRYCWCRCRNCWAPSFPAEGHLTGFCICPACPCRNETAEAIGALKIKRGRHAH